MKILAATLNEDMSHELLKACVVPRPIAWVSTVDSAGVPNLAPFSCFTFVATDPPMICLSIALKRSQKKTTLLNLEASRDFVVNIPAEGFEQMVNQTSAEGPATQNKVTGAGLSVVPSDRVRSPRIAQCAINMECALSQTVELGRSRHTLVIGEVVVFHLDDAILRDGQVDFDSFKPLARLGGENYGEIGRVISAPRSWRKKA
ncbi:MAG TPA: flavin reductase family protein [Acidobacteriota bacterium]|nr:flavin reductase family protein [Acidobacteriota bacterium]